LHNSGEITPPCGVPSSVADKMELKEMPALSHLEIKFRPGKVCNFLIR
jgi:hypothetical protein